MARIEIIAGGRHIAVEAGDKGAESMRLAATQALALWLATEGATPPPDEQRPTGPVGFHTELGSRPEYESAHQIDLRSAR